MRTIPTPRRTDGLAQTGPKLIDARGLKCPWPVLRAARAMREGEAVTLLADDPVALIDVPALAQAHGWSIAVTADGAHQRYELAAPAGD